MSNATKFKSTPSQTMDEHQLSTYISDGNSENGKGDRNIDIYNIIKMNTVAQMQNNGRRLIRDAAAAGGAIVEADSAIDEDCDETTPTVVLNHELIVDYRYAEFHHDDEDVLTDAHLHFFVSENENENENGKENEK